MWGPGVDPLVEEVNRAKALTQSHFEAGIVSNLLKSSHYTLLPLFSHVLFLYFFFFLSSSSFPWGMDALLPSLCICYENASEKKLFYVRFFTVKVEV